MMFAGNEGLVLRDCTLDHFKSVYDSITLPLAPLTIFAGPNSSGKSTLIQSLLLATQTVQNPVRSRSVVLNGHILKLGEFDDVLSDGAEPPVIRLGFSLSVSGQPELSRLRGYGLPGNVDSVECTFSFSGRGSGEEIEVRQLQPRLEEARVKVTASGSDQHEIELAVRRSAYTLQDRLRQLGLDQDAVTLVEAASLEYEIDTSNVLAALAGYYGVPKSSRAAGASLFHFLPSRLSVVFDVVVHQEERVIQLLTAGPTSGDYYYGTQSASDRGTDLSAEILARLKTVLMPVLREYLSEPMQNRLPQMYTRQIHARFDDVEQNFSVESIGAVLRSLPTRDRRQVIARIADKEVEIRSAVRGQRAPQYDLAVIPLPPLVELGVDIIHQFFTRFVKYLGPLRDDPKPVYPLATGADPKDIGYRGQHTAAVLETYRNATVVYHPTRFIAERSATVTKTATLYEAVLDWLQYMGIADEIKTADLGKLGHELKVSAGAGEAVHDLTHVGVGVSQVLPILVLALLADPGSTLIFEQPELHLHPRVQTRLADFFVSLTRLGKQCLVETHSEYLINRLRYRAATSEDDVVSSSTLLYFVERAEGKSHYRPIKINQYGVIEDWPTGFFDETESLAASVLRAGAEKRRLVASKRHG